MDEEPKKKTVLLHSNFSANKSGFGKHIRELATALYRTGKYNIVEFAGGARIRWSDPGLKRTPWPCYGVWPDNDEEIIHFNENPNREAIFRAISYGAHNIDRIIKEVKPDVYIGVEDIWAFNGYWDRKWWDKITPIIHTTLDSLPILDQAVEAAPKIKNYYVWAKFAEEAMHELGHTHVKTIHGAIDTTKFFKLPEYTKRELRERSNIPLNSFVMGFVFRNQLRKSVHNLLDAFIIFKRQNPKLNSKVLLHTNWEEKDQGWDIPKMIKDKGIDNSDILTTYICRTCGDYEIKPFCGNDADCPRCGAKHNPRPSKEEERRGQRTCGVQLGITDQQLNEVYNVMNVYVHPFTSGGQEIPVQEAKLAELVTLVTSYSCGTEYCTEESGGMALEWVSDVEPGTQFIKARTSPNSIAKQLTKLIKMPIAKIKEMGKKGRKFVIQHCSADVIAKEFEKIIDEAPFSTWDFNFEEPLRNPNFPNPEIEDTKEWLKSLYKNILLMDVSDEDSGLLYWIKDIEGGRPRIGAANGVYEYFINEARQLNDRHHPIKIESFFDDNGKKKALFVIPESIGDCFLVTSLFESFTQQYPEFDLYVGTKQQYFEIFEGNPYVYKCVPYIPIMEQEQALIGFGDHKGIVDIAFLPHITTQRQLNYLGNGLNKIAFDIDLDNPESFD